MFAKMRKRINATQVVAIAALLFAMSGAAFAANRYLITSTKQISPKVLKSLRGADGKAGAPGPQGPAGAAGAKGETGASGKEGPQGPKGEAGKDGKDGKQGTTGAAGTTGATGQTGFTEKLPAGKTETGSWSVGLFSVTVSKTVSVPISFPIPLATGSEEDAYFNAEQTEEGEFSGGCQGTLREPTAPPGKLCIYTEEREVLENAKFFGVVAQGEFGYGPAGGFLNFQAEGSVAKPATLDLKGTWAVTAPTS